jgi:hypothetical protein
MLIENFLTGYMKNPPTSYEVYYIQTITDESNVQEIFLSTEFVLLAFPLFTDAMPGRVKQFIELLRPISQNSREANPKLLFLVQSGFPEAIHSRYIEKYLQKLTHRLNCVYVGTIVRGGAMAVHQLFPKFIEKRIIQLFKNRMRRLGKEFGETGNLDEKMLKKCANPERLPRIVKIMYSVYSLIGIKYFGFDAVLKENAAFQYRDAAPYAPSESECVVKQLDYGKGHLQVSAPGKNQYRGYKPL